MINSRVFTEEDGRMEKVLELNEILYLILDYPHKHYTFKHFEV